MPGAPPALEIRGLRKTFGGLRPLRIEHLALDDQERLALSGLDAPAAEVLVSLLTGASLPDEGEVLVHGRPTASVTAEAEWLSWLERFGVVSRRAVLLDSMSVAQNLALPFTLDIDPVAPGVQPRVAALAGEVGIDGGLLDRPLREAPAGVRARVHVARALAQDPRILLLEHPTADLPAADVPAYAADIVRVATARRLAILAVSEDRTFAGAVAERTLALDAATGRVAPARRWRWF